ncbi:hypothetical protein ACP6L2_01190 [Sphingobacterium lactis]|uniref:hypothetical protein n=1 Tax=Sphingobacterium lactis TaxID=797291 RepID=UPI003F7E840A
MISGEKIKRLHGTSWKDFFKIYPIYENLKKSKLFKLSLFLCFIFSCFSFYSESSFVLLVKVNELNLSIIPNVLGFALGGYAMLIGGFSDSILSKLVKIDAEEYNTFQKTSATFGVALLSMCVSLILNYLIKWFINTEISNHFSLTNHFALLINVSVIFIINIISIYSIFLTINIVKNIFAFSQFISGMKTIEKVIKENKKNSK